MMRGSPARGALSSDRAPLVAPYDASDHVAIPLRGAPLFRTWTTRVAAGEAVGFLVPATVGVAVADQPDGLSIALVVLAAGAVEGAVLGFAQQAVLRKALPAIRGGRWTVLTAAAAVVAYALGFVIAFLSGHGSAPAVAGSLAAIGLLLTTIGGAQWIELRHHVPGGARWVAWTAVAWLGGLVTFLLIATPLWHDGQSAAAAVAIGAVAGAAMAVVQAAVTGWGLLRLLAGGDF